MTKLLLGQNLKNEALALVRGPRQIYFLADYKIEEVRILEKKLCLKGPKTVIILDAHKLGIAGQNALLKTLEEPRPETEIILTAPFISSILPTIVSRCEITRINKPFQPESEIDELMLKFRNKLLQDISQKNLAALKYIIQIKNLLENTNVNQKLALNNLNLKLYGRFN